MKKLKDGEFKKVKETATSYRLEKDKPLDEQLEDEFWCIVAKMGFDELSERKRILLFMLAMNLNQGK